MIKLKKYSACKWEVSKDILLYDDLMLLSFSVSPERVLILLQEDMRVSLTNTLWRVETFLNIPHFHYNIKDESHRWNILDVLHLSKARGIHMDQVLPETKRLLHAIYSPHMHRLRTLLAGSSNRQHRDLLHETAARWLRTD